MNFLFFILTLCCVCCSANQPFNFFFLLPSFVFFPLHDILLLFVCRCLESHPLYPHPPLLFICCSAGVWCLWFTFFFHKHYDWCISSYCCSKPCIFYSTSSVFLGFFPSSLFVLCSLFIILCFILHVVSLNLWFVLFICFISLFV